MLRRPELEVLHKSLSQEGDESEAHSSANHICTTAASEIGSIVYHCINTTGAGLLGFGTAYGIYTAATAVTYPLIRLATSNCRSPTEIAHSEPGLLLGFFVDSLVKLQPTMPGIERSFIMLTKHIVKMLGKDIAGHIFSSHAQKEGCSSVVGPTQDTATATPFTPSIPRNAGFLSDQVAIDTFFPLSISNVRGRQAATTNQTTMSFDQYLLSLDFNADDGNFNTLPIFPGTLLELINTDLFNSRFDAFSTSFAPT
jgi:hypothetical protein